MREVEDMNTSHFFIKTDNEEEINDSMSVFQVGVDGIGRESGEFVRTTHSVRTNQYLHGLHL
jgi:cyclophilin family peptidyl-prolyl cis-trans isomerase